LEFALLELALLEFALLELALLLGAACRPDARRRRRLRPRPLRQPRRLGRSGRRPRRGRARRRRLRQEICSDLARRLVMPNPKARRPTVTRTATTAAQLQRMALAITLAALTSLVSLGGADLQGLKSAGLTGTPPPNAALIKQLLDTLASNWLWLVGTGVGLVLVLLAGMLAFGSRSAPDVLFRVIAGIGLILVVIPTALA
jgi:hypothetical protein